MNLIDAIGLGIAVGKGEYLENVISTASSPTELLLDRETPTASSNNSDT